MSPALRSLAAGLLCLGVFAAALAWQQPATAPAPVLGAGARPAPRRHGPAAVLEGQPPHALALERRRRLPRDDRRLVQAERLPVPRPDRAQRHRRGREVGRRRRPTRPARQGRRRSTRTGSASGWVETRTETDGQEAGPAQAARRVPQPARGAGQVPARSPPRRSPTATPSGRSTSTASTSATPSSRSTARTRSRRSRVNLRQVADQRTKTGRRDDRVPEPPELRLGRAAPRRCCCADELRFFEVFNGHPGVRNYGDAHARLAPSGCGTSRWRCGWASTSCRSSTAWRPTTRTATTSGASGKVNPGRGWVMVQGPAPHRRGGREGAGRRRLLRQHRRACSTRWCATATTLRLAIRDRTGRDVQDRVRRHDEGGERSTPKRESGQGRQRKCR